MLHPDFSTSEIVKEFIRYSLVVSEITNYAHSFHLHHFRLDAMKTVTYVAKIKRNEKQEHNHKKPEH
jgi:hypothetical protein